MRIIVLFLVCALFLSLALPTKAQQSSPLRFSEGSQSHSVTDSRALIQAYDRATAGAEFIREIMETPGKSIPLYIFDNAKAIAIFTSRLRFEDSLFGDDYVGGLVSLRDPQTRQWGPPIFLKLDDGTIEDKVEDGGVMIVFAMDQQAANAFLQDKVELAGLAGPFGQIGEAGVEPTAVMHGFFAYLRENGQIDRFGAFTGHPLPDSSEVYHDKELNQAVYGMGEPIRFLPVSQAIPTRVLIFTEMLNRYSRAVGV
ncbi:MAG: hypothetical protein AB1489_19355 [Acidobacteriota bacterium]